MSRLHRGRKQLREKLTSYARELGYVKSDGQVIAPSKEAGDR